jgi:hypothetical protein
MNGEALQNLLDAGEILFASLEQETSACLNKLESMQPHEIESFVEKRQEILSVIQKYDTEIHSHVGRFGLSSKGGALEKYRQQHSSLLKRVIEADGLLLALAGIEMAVLKTSLSGISRGRKALKSYREEGDRSSSALKRIA